MKYSKPASVYALTVGIMMICMWLFFIIAGLVPEFESRPAEIILHLVAEFSTALFLITAAITTLKGCVSGRWLYPLSLGMLLYTLIVSPGYYLQSADYIFVIMFSVLLILTVLFLYIHLKFYKGNNNES